MKTEEYIIGLEKLVTLLLRSNIQLETIFMTHLFEDDEAMDEMIDVTFYNNEKEQKLGLDAAKLQIDSDDNIAIKDVLKQLIARNQE